MVRVHPTQLQNFVTIKTKPPVDLEVLLKEVEDVGYSATGRKYGVSDNTIRKWINKS